MCLNTNESSYPVPDVVVRAALDALEDDLVGLEPLSRPRVHRPAQGPEGMSRAGRCRGHPEQLWAGNGSNGALTPVQAFGGPGTALGFTPSYSMHPIITETLGTTWVDGLREAETFDLTAASAAAQAHQHDPSIVFLCSPNNPTGTALPFDVIGAVLAAAPNAVVVVDEAYAVRPAGHAERPDVAPRQPAAGRDPDHEQGVRLRWRPPRHLVASAELVDALRSCGCPTTCPPRPRPSPASRSSTPSSCCPPSMRSRPSETASSASSQRWERPPSRATRTSSSSAGPDEKATWQALLDRGILVRDVGIRHHLRVTAGTPEETTRFLAAMAELATEHVGPLATLSTVDPLPFETAEDDA